MHPEIFRDRYRSRRADSTFGVSAGGAGAVDDQFVSATSMAVNAGCLCRQRRVGQGDLMQEFGFAQAAAGAFGHGAERIFGDVDGKRSEERRVGKGVDLGGRRIIKKKTKKE